MRIPTSDGAGQRGNRRRGRGAANPGSDRDNAGPDAGSPDAGSRDAGRRRLGRGLAGGSHAGGSSADITRAGGSGLGAPGAGTRTTSTQYPAGSGRSQTSAGSSVFAPGYDNSRAGGDSAPARGASSWYGSTAGGAAGKGPVRGYPPVPGQPPPMYPPGQFAAWNAGEDSRPRPGSQPGGPQDRDQPNRGFGARPGHDGSQPDQAERQSAQQTEAGSRYYDSSGAEPGYSVLAVSDPAADVTSTQTWHAVGDGRATGTWTAPARPGAGPDGQPGNPRSASGRHSALPDIARPDAPSPAEAIPGPGRRDLSGPEHGAGRAAPDGDGRDRLSRDGDRQNHEQRRASTRSGAGRSGAHSGPQAAVRTERGPEAEPRPPRGKSPAGRKRSASGNRPASVKLAFSVALLLVLIAAGTLAYTVFRTAPKPKPASAAPPAKQPKVTPSASPSLSLGPYGHIASRESDPQPLTIAQLFPASFTAGGRAVTLTASAKSKRCGAAVSGANLQSAVSSAHCDQAVRATYLASAQGLMGTIGVLNLSTAAKAAKAAKAADASDFISQLPAKRGPTRKIGQGTGIEEALAKGHYLILIWAEFTSLHRPKAGAERTTVENFMTELLQNTANISLTNRFMTGSA